MSSGDAVLYDRKLLAGTEGVALVYRHKIGWCVPQGYCGGAVSSARFSVARSTKLKIVLSSLAVLTAGEGVRPIFLCLGECA
jgi:hypothetical protein